MKKFAALIPICGVLFAANFAAAQSVSASWLVGGKITFTPDPVGLETLGLELQSPDGYLVPEGDDPGPTRFCCRTLPPQSPGAP